MLSAALRAGELALVVVCAKAKDGKTNIKAKTDASNFFFINIS
jgi:hypothetical protein